MSQMTDTVAVIGRPMPRRFANHRGRGQSAREPHNASPCRLRYQSGSVARSRAWSRSGCRSQGAMPRPAEFTQQKFRTFDAGGPCQYELVPPDCGVAGRFTWIDSQDGCRFWKPSVGYVRLVVERPINIFVVTPIQAAFLALSPHEDCALRSTGRRQFHQRNVPSLRVCSGPQAGRHRPELLGSFVQSLRQIKNTAARERIQKTTPELEGTEAARRCQTRRFRGRPGLRSHQRISPAKLLNRSKKIGTIASASHR